MRCRNQVVIYPIGVPLQMTITHVTLRWTPLYAAIANVTTVYLTLLFPFRNSSLKPMKDLRRLALIPRGGSIVIFELFWSTGTGNLGLGMLVSHRRKSRCTCVCTWTYVHVCMCKYVCGWMQFTRTSPPVILHTTSSFFITQVFILQLCLNAMPCYKRAC